MLSKIGTVAAGIAGGPQLANPNATLAQKTQGILGILGKIGNVGVMATGSPQQREQAIQQQGQQNQMQQMKNEAQYRQGMLHNTEEKNSTYAEKVASDAARKDQQSDLDHLKMNMVKDPVTGTYRTATPDETLNNQFMDHNQQAWHDANTLKQAQANLDDAKRNATLDPDNVQNKMKLQHYEAQIKMAQQRFDLSNAQFQRGTQQFAAQDAERQANMQEGSYKFTTENMEKARVPAETQLAKLTRLNDTINQKSPLADAIVAPELLTAMVGGQGSGLRMNEAEISRIVGGRNNWENLKSKIMAYQTDPSKPFSITDEQRKQMQALIPVIAQRLKAKVDVINGAEGEVADPNAQMQEHKQSFLKMNQQLSAIDNMSDEAVKAQAAQPTARITPKAGSGAPLTPAQYMAQKNAGAK
jgi:hypothetical protein